MTDTEMAMKRFDRASTLYDIFKQPMETMFLKKRRMEAAQGLGGKILEVGVGTGKNIPHYPGNADVTAIDFSQKMLLRAKGKAQKHHKSVKLLQMDAQKMDFPDDSFDTVYTTCVLCSIPDPVVGLREIKRVCKPGGTVVMIEHVRSENRLLGLMMDIMNPLCVRICGANINRRTVENVRKAGFADFEAVNLAGDILKKIVIHN